MYSEGVYRELLLNRPNEFNGSSKYSKNRHHCAIESLVDKKHGNVNTVFLVMKLGTPVNTHHDERIANKHQKTSKLKTAKKNKTWISTMVDFNTTYYLLLTNK